MSTLDPPRDFLPWVEVERLVRSAAPVRVSWLAGLARGGERQLRYALAPLALLLVVVALWAMPAQSDQVGTLVVVRLPSAWQIDGTEIGEVCSAARERFAGIGVAQSDICILIERSENQQRMALWLLGVERSTARSFFVALARDYPALDAFEPGYASIDSGEYGNRLTELVVWLTQAGRLPERDLSALGEHVLMALDEAGFEDIRVVTSSRDDGTVVIEVDATLQDTDPGQEQEDSQAAAAARDPLAEKIYKQVLDEVALR